MNNENNIPVSIIIPCRNEEKHIGTVIENILAQTYNQNLIEIIIVDGLSDDKTVNIIGSYFKKYPQIKLYNNPNKVVPYALNIGIKESHGEVIIRMDAHCHYPNNYVAVLIDKLISLEADNVGATWNTLPGNGTLIAKSIALATSSGFGIGNASYRLSNSGDKLVDTVPFGCYRRSVFDKIGYFDEEMIRNQDDEFNARLLMNGGKIYLIGNLVIDYYARPTISKMFRMFYQYGLFKPLVVKKVGVPVTLRQFIPLCFVLFLFVYVFLILINTFLFQIATGILLFYLAIDILQSIRIALDAKELKLILTLPITFFLIHFSYGLGYVSGIFRFILFRKKIKSISLSR